MSEPSATDQFTALSEPIQEQLIRIARKAAGMSTEEKEFARVFLGSVVLHAAGGVDDDGVAAADLVAACGQVVKLVDEASGSAASWLVV